MDRYRVATQRPYTYSNALKQPTNRSWQRAASAPEIIDIYIYRLGFPGDCDSSLVLAPLVLAGDFPHRDGPEPGYLGTLRHLQELPASEEFQADINDSLAALMGLREGSWTRTASKYTRRQGQSASHPCTTRCYDRPDWPTQNTSWINNLIDFIGSFGCVEVNVSTKPSVRNRREHINERFF
jgi:hypothetical protein